MTGLGKWEFASFIAGDFQYETEIKRTQTQNNNL